MKFSVPKGTFDISPYFSGGDEWKNIFWWQFVENTVRKMMHTCCILEIRTPIFEDSEVFVKTSGESSDIVTKEMYTFCDKGGRSITLRPELTASVARSIVSNNFDTYVDDIRLFYIGPMFRYSRQQKGRYRQFHQFGMEMIGNNSIEQDAELLTIVFDIYKKLGIDDVNISINMLCNVEGRKKYCDTIKNIVADNIDKISEDSKKRLNTNPLRILDSKDERDIEVVKTLPTILDFLSTQERYHFEELLLYLKDSEVNFTIDDKLVRGLDYYNGIVFEIVDGGSKGSQGSLGGGGRYDGLIKLMKGQNLPGVGFSMGIERVIQSLVSRRHKNNAIATYDATNVLLIALGNQELKKAFFLARTMRNEGIAVNVDFRVGKLKKSLKAANKLKASFVIVVGEKELSAKIFAVKNMSSGIEEDIKEENLLQYLKKLLKLTI